MPYKDNNKRNERVKYFKSLPIEEQKRIYEERQAKIKERKSYIQAVKECKLKRKCLRKEIAWLKKRIKTKLWMKTEKGIALRKAIKKRYLKTAKGKVALLKRSQTSTHRALNAIRRTKNKALDILMTDFDKFVFKEAYELRTVRENKLSIKWHVDHIVPISKGGTNIYYNMQVVPAIWNLKKGNLHESKYFGDKNG